MGPTDILYSRYIRLRDSVWNEAGERVGECITCNRKLVVFTSDNKFVASSQCGHMIGRGCFQLRYNEQNNNLQCAHCNNWLDKDEMIQRYREAVDLKYGHGTYQRLKAASKAEGAYKLPSKTEMMQIMKEASEQITFYLDKKNRKVYSPKHK